MEKSYPARPSTPEELYVDEIENSGGDWGVFGEDSGHCYSSHSSKFDAEDSLVDRIPDIFAVKCF